MSYSFHSTNLIRDHLFEFAKAFDLISSVQYWNQMFSCVGFLRNRLGF